MAYTPESTPSLESQKFGVAKKIITALESQAGLDVLPAQAALPRILTGVWKLSGYKFKLLGHGRMRFVFDIVGQSGDSIGLVLKLGCKQATSRDIALTLVYPEDRAKIYGASEYGVVVEKVDCIKQVSDPRIETPEFKARVIEFADRYIGVSYEDVGYIGDRIVMIGSSTRVIKKDAKIGTSSTQQIRTV